MLCAIPILIPIPILLRIGDTKHSHPPTRARALRRFPFSSHSKGYYTHTHTHTHPSSLSLFGYCSRWRCPHVPCIWVWTRARAVGLGLLCGCGCGNHRACFRYAGVEGPGPTSRPWAFASRDSSSTDPEQYLPRATSPPFGYPESRAALGRFNDSDSGRSARPANSPSSILLSGGGYILRIRIRIRIRAQNATVEKVFSLDGTHIEV
ncbi:hypothetical protein B0H14DRAFT_2958093 [Mycena olivaceomarginata]|nr:hypothetical protein B0H14DRAFT_2958093 [Mycena olivaceomarginata]